MVKDRDEPTIKATGTISRITVSGDGSNADSAEIVVEINSEEANRPVAVRIGAGMVPHVFVTMYNLLLLAYQTGLKLTIGAKLAEDGGTPEIISVALPDKIQPKKKILSRAKNK